MYISKYGSGIIGKSIFERKTMNRMAEGNYTRLTSVKEHCLIDFSQCVFFML